MRFYVGHNNEKKCSHLTSCVRKTNVRHDQPERTNSANSSDMIIRCLLPFAIAIFSLGSFDASHGYSVRPPARFVRKVGTEQGIPREAAVSASCPDIVATRATFLGSPVAAAARAFLLVGLVSVSDANAASALASPPLSDPAGKVQSGLVTLSSQAKKIDRAVTKETKKVTKEIKRGAKKVDSAVVKGTKRATKEIKKEVKEVKREAKKADRAVTKEMKKVMNRVDREAEKIGVALERNTGSLVGGKSSGTAAPLKGGVDTSKIKKVCNNQITKCI